MAEKKSIFDYVGRPVDIDIAYVRASTINWQDKTMKCIDLRTGQEYDNVSLQQGNIFLPPFPDTNCLIVLYSNIDLPPFILSCDQLDVLGINMH